MTSHREPGNGQQATGTEADLRGRPKPLGAKAIESYRDLKVWQAAVELAVLCSECTRSFPASEAYAMTSQIRRSATSVAANIAEGYGRGQTGAYLNFLRIAHGSLRELETHVTIAARVGLLPSSQQLQLGHAAEEVARMLWALIRKVERAP